MMDSKKTLPYYERCFDDDLIARMPHDRLRWLLDNFYAQAAEIERLRARIAALEKVAEVWELHERELRDH